MIIPQPERCAWWTHTLAQVDIPVLESTAQAIATWREDTDRVDAHLMADTILCDPLMTLRVLIRTASLLGDRLATPVETVTASLVHTGIEPFFAHFTNLPVLEQRLAHQPLALAGALQAVDDAYRAARLAAAIAIERQDEDAEVLHQAALLANFGNLLIWSQEPGMALDMQQRQHLDSGLRSADVQRLVLGAEIEPVEDALMLHWGLPECLRKLMHAGMAAQPGPRSVSVAVRLARHSREGWDNAALPDDCVEVGHLLNITPAAAADFVQSV